MVSEDRGQLLLVAGVLLALVIVSSAVLLNGIVAPGTSGTRGIASEVDTFQHDLDPVRDGLEDLFETTTAVHEYGEALPYAHQTEIEQNVTAYGAVTRDVTAEQRGSLVTVAYNNTHSLTGQVILQRGTPRAFQNNTGHGEWNLATGVRALPRASFTITDPTVSTGIVNVTNAVGTTWELRVADTGLQVNPPGETPYDVCDGVAAYPGEEIHVEVKHARARNATVHVVTSSGERLRCDGFPFGEGVSGVWDVGIQNGGEIVGTYVVGIANGGTVSPGSGTNTWPATKGTATSVVVNPAVDVTYLSDGITYESTFAVYNRTEP